MKNTNQEFKKSILSLFVEQTSEEEDKKVFLRIYPDSYINTAFKSAKGAGLDVKVVDEMQGILSLPQEELPKFKKSFYTFKGADSYSAKEVKRSVAESLLKEQDELNKYKGASTIKSDPEAAATELLKLIDQLIPLVEAALEKGGPFSSQMLLDDFKSDLNDRLKTVKLPTTAKLSSIMSDVEAASADIEQAEKQKEQTPAK